MHPVRLAASLALAATALVTAASATDARVRIGEVSSNVERAGIDYESLLRSASEEELRSLDLSRVPRHKQVIVSVALVRLDTFAEPQATDTSCVVNATLRDAKGGAVFAILEGRARAKGGDARAALERSVVQGALHGALGRIPEVLRR